MMPAIEDAPRNAQQPAPASDTLALRDGDANGLVALEAGRSARSISHGVQSYRSWASTNFPNHIHGALQITEELHRCLTDFDPRNPNESEGQVAQRLADLEQELRNQHYPEPQIQRAICIERVVVEFQTSYQKILLQGEMRAIDHWAAVKLSEMDTTAFLDLFSLEVAFHGLGRLARLEYDTITRRIVELWLANRASSESATALTNLRPSPDRTNTLSSPEREGASSTTSPVRQPPRPSDQASDESAGLRSRGGRNASGPMPPRAADAAGTNPRIVSLDLSQQAMAQQRLETACAAGPSAPTRNAPSVEPVRTGQGTPPRTGINPASISILESPPLGAHVQPGAVSPSHQQLPVATMPPASLQPQMIGVGALLFQRTPTAIV